MLESPKLVNSPANCVTAVSRDCRTFAVENKNLINMGKVLIAYYSRRGENYVNGSIVNLKLGNTEVVAGKIKALLPDADVFQIDTTYEYSKDYMTCIEV